MSKNRHKTVFLAVVLSFILVFTFSCASNNEKTPISSKDTPPIEETESIEATNDDTTLEEAIEDNSTEEEPIEEDSIVEEPIDFENLILYDLLKKELGKDEIYPKDLASYISINIAADKFVFLASEGDTERSLVHINDDIFEYDGVMYEGFVTMKSLADLKYFSSLENIYVTLQPEINFNTIPDENSEKVRVLQIYQSQLEDISFLEKFENLIALGLDMNNIKDLSPLEGKDTIYYLNLCSNEVEDLTPIASITSLRSITAYSNKIAELTPLTNLPNLEEIEFYDNLIKDISPLKEIRTLKRVELINNLIEDVSPLQEFEFFEELRLTGNPITNIHLLDHITNLEF